MLLIDDNSKLFIAVVNEKGEYLNRYKDYEATIDKFVENPLDATEFFEYTPGDTIYDAEYYTGCLHVEHQAIRPVIMQKNTVRSVFTSHPTTERPPSSLAEAIRFVHNQ